MIRVSVMYPNEGGNFDMEYYTNKYMALVHKLLESYGLVRTAVDKGIGTAEPGVPPPFMAIGYLVFNSIEDMPTGLNGLEIALGDSIDDIRGEKRVG